MRWSFVLTTAAVAIFLTMGSLPFPEAEVSALSGIIRTSLDVDTVISDHYAVTDVKMTLNNPATMDSQTSFYLTIPEGSMLSNISLVLDGRTHYASVTTVQEASDRYDDAVKKNQTATKIEGTSDPRTFKVTLNIEANGQVKVGFRHESVILRKLGYYDHAADLGDIPGYTDFEEVRGRVSIRSVNNITKLETERSTMDLVEAWSGKGSVDLTFSTGAPSDYDRVRISFKEEPRPGAGVLTTYEDSGGGYFMHLFTPELAEMGSHLPKDIVFVLDRSGSMSGTKISQMKDAFGNIVHQLLEGDSFDMVIFSSGTEKYSMEMQPASTTNMDTAERYIDELEAGGSTNINLALLDALDLLDENEGAIPIVVFLTDGLATEGVTNTLTIRDNVKVANDGLGASIYTIGFGEDVDFEFLKALALENDGAALKIPANAQASSMLTDFYDTISIPLLMDITFSYGENAYDVYPGSLPGLYDGSEALIVGRYEPGTGTINAEITARDAKGPVTYTEDFVVDPDPYLNMIPRLWAFRKISDLTDRITVEGETQGLVENITSIALRYSFATEYTSFILVVEEMDDSRTDNEGPSPNFGGGDADGDGVIDGNEHDPPKDDNEGPGGAIPMSLPEREDMENNSILLILVIIGISCVLALVIFGMVRYNKNVLDQENRKRIYEHINDHPGDHFRAIQRAMGLEVGTLSHHINVLEKEQLIVSEQDGNNRLFYPAGMKGRDDKVRLSRIQENILKSIRMSPGRTQSEIARDIGVSRKVIYYHVRFLKDSGMVNEEQVGNHPRYYPN